MSCCLGVLRVFHTWLGSSSKMIPRHLCLVVVVSATVFVSSPTQAQEPARPGEPTKLTRTFGPGFTQRFGRGLLLHRLSTGLPQVRAAAAVELGRRRDSNAVPALIEMLEGASVGSNREAGEAIVQALGDIGDRRAVPVLLGLLSSRGPLQRGAIRALGQIGDERALDPIAALLSRPSLSRDAVTALLRLGPRVLIRVVSLLRDPSTAGSACELLGRLGDRRAMWPMVQALNSPRAAVRRKCARALGRLGDSRAQQALHGLLQDPDTSVRGRALSALVIIAGGDMGPLLVPLVAEEERGHQATKALRGRSARAAIPDLAKAARTEASPHQVEAVLALGRIGGSEAAEILGSLLLSERVDTLHHAAAALATIGVEHGLEPLLSAARAKGPVRIEGLLGLAELFRPAPIARPHFVVPREIRTLARQTLTDPSPEIVGAGALLVGAIRDESSLARLGALLREGASPALRALAASVLGHLDSSAACPLLIEALADDHEGVCAAAAWSAGELRCRSAGPTLAAVIEGGSDGVAGNAAWAVGAIRYRPAVPALRRRLDEGGTALRANAALALAALGDRRSVAAIRRRLGLEQSPRVRAALVDALGRLGDSSSRRVLEDLQSDEHGTAAAALARDALEAIERGDALTTPRGSSTFRGRLIDGRGNPLVNVWYTLALPDRRIVGGVTGPTGDIVVTRLPNGLCYLGLGANP